MAKLRVGSLFSGIGGFDLGLERAGLECRFQIEIDPFCNKVLEKHWPGVKRYGDIRKIDTAELEPVDLVCGGFPCQDLSVAGKRAGLAGERSGLFFEFMRILAGVRPALVVIENVPGLLSSNGGKDMGTVLGTLGQLGYGYAYRVLDAQYFGVAQRRRRVFIVGHFGEPWSAPAKVLFEPESCERDTPPSRKAGKVAPTLSSSGAGTSRTGNERTEADMLTPFDTTQITSKGNYSNPKPGDPCHPLAAGAHPPAIARTLTSPHSPRFDGDTDNFVIHETVSKPLCFGKTTNHYDEGQQTYIAIQANPSKADKPDSTTYVIQDTAETLTGHWHRSNGAKAGNNAGMINPIILPMAVRRLTPMECERLQGFPDGWTEGESGSARYRMLGNAVCVPVAEWIGKAIMKVESSGIGKEA